MAKLIFKQGYLIDDHFITPDEAGEMLGVTRERVRQLNNLGLLEDRLKGAPKFKPWEHIKKKEIDEKFRRWKIKEELEEQNLYSHRIAFKKKPNS